jgi:hypothetical protein
VDRPGRSLLPGRKSERYISALEEVGLAMKFHQPDFFIFVM